MSRLLPPPIVCQNAMWLYAGGFLVMAIDPHNADGWRVAWGGLALVAVLCGFWMLHDLIRRGDVKL